MASKSIIPEFGPGGSVLTEEEKKRFARQKGICYTCQSVQTHDRKRFSLTLSPLTNDDVYEGVCIKCNQDVVPKQVYSDWKKRNRPAQADPSGRSPGKHRGSRRRRHPRVKSESQMNQTNSPSPAAVPRLKSEPFLGASADDAATIVIEELNLSLPELAITKKEVPSTRPERQNSRPKEDLFSDSDERSNPSRPSSKVCVKIAPPANDSQRGHSFKESLRSQSTLLGLGSTEFGELLEDNMDDPAALRTTLHALRNDYNDGDYDPLIQPLKEVLTRYEHEPTVLEAACGALWRVAAHDSAAKHAIVESGSMDLVVKAMSKNRYNVEFTEWAMGAITSIAAETEHKEYLSKINAIEAILDTLQDYPDKACVFEWACRSLYAFVASDGSTKSTEIASRNCALIEESDGIVIILNAMKANVSEHVAQIVAIKLLWEFSGSDDETVRVRILRKLADANIAPLLTRLIRLPSTCTELFCVVADLLCVLFSEDQGDELVTNALVGCLPSVVRRMKEDLQIEKALRASLKVFTAIVVLGDVPSHSLEDLDAPRAVIDALDLLLEDSRSIKSGLLALWKLSAHSPPVLDHTMVVSTLNIIRAAFMLESFSVEEYKAAFGFIVNTRMTQGLQLADLPLKALLAIRFEDQASDEKARSVAADSLHFICRQFPEFGNDAVRYMANDDSLRIIGDGNIEKILPLARTVMASGAGVDLDLPGAIISIVAVSLSKIRDPTVLELVLNLVVVSLGDSRDDIPPATIEALVKLFKQHEHQPVLYQSMLDSMTRVFLLSPSGLDTKATAESILDLILPSSVDDDIHVRALDALWTLLAMNPCDDVDTLYRIYKHTFDVLERFVGDNAEAFNPSLIETTCGLLAVVAGLVRSTPFSVAEEELKTVMSIVCHSMEVENSLPIPCLVFEALYHFCFVDQDILVQSGAIAILAEAIDKLGFESRLLDTVFALMAQLASSEDTHINLSIVFSEGVDSLICGMKLYPEHVGIQMSGCKAFSHLSVEGETRCVICEQGGITLVLSALEAHEENRELVEYACSALLNMTCDVPELFTEESEMIARIVHLLRVCQQSPLIQRDCMGILQNISMERNPAKEAIARSGGLDAVLDTVKVHTDWFDIIARAFATLWSLALLDDNRRIIVASGGVDSVVGTMMRLVECDEVQAKACGFICTVALDESARAIIKKAGGCEAIVYAMLVHFDSAEVLCEAARALSVIYQASDGQERPEPSDEELDAVLMAMREFPLDENVQERTCAALLSILLSSSHKFGSYFKDIRHLMQGASQFPSCTVMAVQVQSLVCDQMIRDELPPEGLHREDTDTPPLTSTENSEQDSISEQQLPASAVEEEKFPDSAHREDDDGWNLVESTDVSRNESSEALA